MHLVLKNQSLKPFNTFGVDVHSHYLFELRDVSQLEYLATLPQPQLILGEGSNILFTKDYEGTVILNRLKGIHVLDETNDQVLIQAFAGENWHEFVSYTLTNHWYGLENLALIPGTVGAAPVQNIGAYGIEIGSCIDQVHIYHPGSGKFKTLRRSECQLGYRDSVFKHEKKDWLIISVVFSLYKKPSVSMLYPALHTWFTQHHKDKITPELIYKAVIDIRQSKLPDVHKIGSAGSFFKNPVVSVLIYEALKKQFPELVAYPFGSTGQEVKLAAAQLIELTGVKGKYVNNVGMYEKQALILVNLGGASGEEIFSYSKQIQEKVYQLFMVSLEPEPLII